MDTSDVTDARGFGFPPAVPAPTPPKSYATESYSELVDGDFEYHMRHKSRGVALIINNDEFMPSSQMTDRAGSRVDRDHLVEALRYVGFKEIEVRDNLTGRKMVQTMEQAAMVDYSDKDCLFVAMLSHGDDGQIYGTDEPVSYDTLLKPFKEKSTTLAGKPKIFVIQACRGEKLDSGVKFTSDVGPPKKKEYFISRESDFLLAYSVVPGYYSWRNCSNGSWFIQAFCEVMKRDGRRLEFVQMLTRVNRMVSYTFKSNASSVPMTNKKQSPCITSMLTKALFFN